MKVRKLIISLVAAYSVAAVAENPTGYMTDSGVVITPILNVGFKYDDNIFSQESDTKGSRIFTLAPAVSFLLDDGINNYQLDVRLESGTFIDSHDDNYVSGNLDFKSHLEASSRSRFDILLSASKDVEARGTGITEGQGDVFNEPLEYNDQAVKLTYELGDLSSNGRIALTGKYYNKNFTNFTDITQFRSYDQPTIGTTFFYTTNANTEAFIEINGSSIGYDATEAISRDSDVYNALVGVQWEATALTSGSFKIGQEQKKVSADGREDFKGVSWEGNIDWQPLIYSTLTLETSRSAKDPDIQGDYISESVYGLNWKHEWSDFFTSNLNVSYTNEDYSGFERVDKTNDLYAELIYKFTRWSDVSFFVELTEKDSTNDSIVYDKNIIGLDFTLLL